MTAIEQHRSAWPDKSDEWLFERLDRELKSKVDTIHNLLEQNGRLNEAMRRQSSTKIKQLEWIGSEGGNVLTGIAIYAGYYRITSTSEGAWMRIATAGIRKRFDTVDEAKAAAQADFERRVMGCLDIADNSNK